MEQRPSNAFPFSGEWEEAQRLVLGKYDDDSPPPPSTHQSTFYTSPSRKNKERSTAGSIKRCLLVGSWGCCLEDNVPTTGWGALVFVSPAP